MTKMKRFLQKTYQEYKHMLLLLYFPIYLAWFVFLEQKVTTHFHVIHMDIDDYIPIYEIFIIPYLLWFAYIAVVIIYMGFKDKSEFCKMCAFLFTGMTIFLIVSTVYPNGHNLRPISFERDNIFTQLCAMLYQTDTATNLFPSIHVYNSIGVHLAIANSEKTKHNKLIRFGSGFLMVSIILATVFLKQHSMFDVITAFLLAIVMYFMVYVRSWENLLETAKRQKKRIKEEKEKLKKRLPEIQLIHSFS